MHHEVPKTVKRGKRVFEETNPDNVKVNNLFNFYPSSSCFYSWQGCNVKKIDCCEKNSAKSDEKNEDGKRKTGTGNYDAGDINVELTNMLKMMLGLTNRERNDAVKQSGFEDMDDASDMVDRFFHRNQPECEKRTMNKTASAIDRRQGRNRCRNNPRLDEKFGRGSTMHEDLRKYKEI